MILSACSKPSSDDLIVVSQQTGVIDTNCYLLYDQQCKKAALIDPGDTIPALLAHIENEQLELQYILITHCHPDHIFGFHTMHLRDKFPNAKVVYSVEECEDMFKVVAKWKEAYPDEVSQEIQNSPVFLKLFSMDYETIGKPDIYIEDNQKLQLGDFGITAIKTPGHARGSVSYHVQNYLFSGDELMYHAVGGTKTSPISSFKAQVKSVRKLYASLPDETIVYPGHGQATTIGEEKTQNKNITLSKAIQ
jgi:glyoxylase-like metal-dependent hydrolase (beta-lactamase superfamily II)